VSCIRIFGLPYTMPLPSGNLRQHQHQHQHHRLSNAVFRF
jgi:hypothetical protein